MPEVIVIAIIDDGVNDNFINKSADHYYVKGNRVLPYTSEKINSHGSKVAYIIDKKCKNCKFVSIKVLNNDKSKGSINKLLLALEWCTKNKIDIINISVGTENYYDRDALGKVFAAIISKGIIIIAAGSNRNRLTYPASFPSVIGVKYDWLKLIPENQFYYDDVPFDGIELIVNSNYIFSDYYIEPCNSFAAPVITALVCNYFEEGIRNSADIRKRLQKESCSGRYEFYNTNLCKKVNKKNEYNQIPVVFINIGYNLSKTDEMKFLVEMINEFMRLQYNCIVISNTFSIPSMNIFRVKDLRSSIIEDLKVANELISSMSNPDILVYYNIYGYDTAGYLKRGLVDVVIEEKSGKYYSLYIESNLLKRTCFHKDTAIVFTQKAIVDKIIKLLS